MSVQHFERNIKNEFSNPINVHLMDAFIFVKPTRKKLSVSNKLEVYNFLSHFCRIRKLEKVLIAKRLLFKKITVMPRGQM